MVRRGPWFPSGDGIAANSVAASIQMNERQATLSCVLPAAEGMCYKHRHDGEWNAISRLHFLGSGCTGRFYAAGWQALRFRSRETFAQHPQADGRGAARRSFPGFAWMLPYGE